MSPWYHDTVMKRKQSIFLINGALIIVGMSVAGFWLSELLSETKEYTDMSTDTVSELRSKGWMPPDNREDFNPANTTDIIYNLDSNYTRLRFTHQYSSLEQILQTNANYHTSAQASESLDILHIECDKIPDISLLSPSWWLKNYDNAVCFKDDYQNLVYESFIIYTFEDTDNGSKHGYYLRAG